VSSLLAAMKLTNYKIFLEKMTLKKRLKKDAYYEPENFFKNAHIGGFFATSNKG
jgi:hypothetical protein